MATVTVVDSACKALPVPGKSSGESLQRLSNADVHEIVARKLGNKDFRLISWKIKPLDEMNGFLGLYYHVYVSALVNNQVENFRFFAKTPPAQDNCQYKFLTRFDGFNKEIAAYTDILPRLDTKKGQNWRVRSYFHRANEILVLEDAIMDGYVTPNKYIAFDYDHCVAMLKGFAKFHAGSLVLDENLRPKGSCIFDVYGHLFHEMLFDGDKRSDDIFKASLNGACTMVDLAEGFDEEQRTIAKNRLRLWCPKISRMLEPSKRYRNVICHRDSWANNFLVKRDATGKPIGFYLIDFQFLRYSPPALDFNLCLHLSTTRDVRDKHMDDFMRIYHDTLKEVLHAEGINVEKCLPWKEFRESCKVYKPAALIYAVLNLQITLLSTDATEQVPFGSAERCERILFGDLRDEIIHQFFQTNDAYKQRNIEIIREIVDVLPDQSMYDEYFES